MDTLLIIIALAIPLGMILGCILGALAELTLNQRENTNV
jgi:uncharacterized protein involved in exopolysaccharide biosynthesis